MRAKLEMAVTRCIELADQQKQEAKQDTESEEYDSDSDNVSDVKGKNVVPFLYK